jgi:hypothetical protein
LPPGRRSSSKPTRASPSRCELRRCRRRAHTAGRPCRPACVPA